MHAALEHGVEETVERPLSHSITSAKLWGRSRGNRPNMPPIACAEKTTPCFFAAAAKPRSARVLAPSFRSREPAPASRGQGGDRHRIARERARLIDRPERRDFLHDCAARQRRPACRR
jgi:hypothetical protein